MTLPSRTQPDTGGWSGLGVYCTCSQSPSRARIPTRVPAGMYAEHGAARRFVQSGADHIHIAPGSLPERDDSSACASGSDVVVAVGSGVTSSSAFHLLLSWVCARAGWAAVSGSGIGAAASAGVSLLPTRPSGNRKQQERQENEGKSPPGGHDYSKVVVRKGLAVCEDCQSLTVYSIPPRP